MRTEEKTEFKFKKRVTAKTINKLKLKLNCASVVVIL